MWNVYIPTSVVTLEGGAGAPPIPKKPGKFNIINITLLLRFINL